LALTSDARRTDAQDAVAVRPPASSALHPTAAIAEVEHEVVAPARTVARGSNRVQVAASDALSHGTLLVRVRDEAGEPLADARVRVRGDSALEWSTGTTGADGTLVFEGVRSGNPKVRVEADGFWSQESRARIRLREPDAELEVSLVQRRAVVVTLVDGTGRELRVGEDGIGDDFLNNARFACAPACARFGDLAPKASDPGCDVARLAGPTLRWRLDLHGRARTCVQLAVGPWILCAQPLAADATEMALRVSLDALRELLAPLEVRVLAEDADTPIANARVGYGSRGNNFLVRRTDADGRVRFAPCFEAACELEVSQPGFVSAHRSRDQLIARDVVVRLGAGRRIEGLLLGEDGAPLPRGTVALHSTDEFGTPTVSEIPRLAKTSREGRFLFEDVAPGMFLVRAHDMGLVEQPVVGPDAISVDCRTTDQRGIVVQKPASAPERRRRVDHAMGPR
jgi:hypothetical protein